MDVNVGIALYSVMIAVLVFITGYVVQYGGRLLMEVKREMGLWEGLMEKCVEMDVDIYEKYGEAEAVFKRSKLVVVIVVFLCIWSVVNVVLALSGVGEENWEAGIGMTFGFFVVSVVIMLVELVYMMSWSAEVSSSVSKAEVLARE